MKNKSVLDVTVDIEGKPIKTYLGNPKLKADGVRIGYNDEMLAEYIACKKDIIYFAERYFYHTHPDLGVKKIELYDYQRDILRNFQNNRFNILLQSRQSGKCVAFKTKIKIRDIETKKEKTISIGHFYHKIYDQSKKLGKDEKFVEKLINTDFEVYTDNGWKMFNGVGMTKPFTEYILFTKNRTLNCADTHLVKRKNKPTYVKDLVKGDFISVDGGDEEVVGIHITKNKKPMFDLLKVSGEYYYTNGILSHNTTVATIYITWYIMFNRGKTIAILANKNQTATEIMSRVKLAIEELPFGLQQGVVKWNEGSVVFDNKSRILGFSTTSSSARGLTANALFIDECAFVPKWEEFYGSVYPTISTSKESKIILVSTPNGKNHFYDIWSRANRPVGDPMKNEFVPYKVTWDMVPGRDAKWRDDTVANFGIEQFEREYNCLFDTKAGTLISSAVLADISEKYKDKKKMTIPGLEDYVKYIWQYEDVIPEHGYVIGADTSTNVEEGGCDETCFQVIDVTKLPYRQVCSIHIDEGISYRLFPYILYALGKYYNDAFIFVENNEGSGRETNRSLEDLGYENIYWDNDILAGVRTTVKSKRLGCENLKAMIENYNIIINDYQTITQLSNFVHNKLSYKAEYGFDDAVMALVMALFFLSLKDNLYLDEVLAKSDIREYDTLTIKTLKNNKYREENEKENDELEAIFKLVLNRDEDYQEERIFKNQTSAQQIIKRNNELDIF